MSGRALTPDEMQARRAARADQALVDEATAPVRAAERRAARLADVEVAITPFNKRILHARKKFRTQRAAARVAKKSRKRNR